jgi:hypothetical protein
LSGANSFGRYLTDAYNGDIRCGTEVSGHLAQDLRQRVHARKVMKSYQAWFGEGVELAVVRMLGLFDRPADEKTFEALLKPPAIHGLTESLTDLSPTEWRRIKAKLRRAKLLAPEDPPNPGQLDTHPLVREYFGEQLRCERTDAWKECNRRLYNYNRRLAPQLPNGIGDGGTRRKGSQAFACMVSAYISKQVSATVPRRPGAGHIPPRRAGTCFSLIRCQNSGSPRE